MAVFVSVSATRGVLSSEKVWVGTAVAPLGMVWGTREHVWDTAETRGVGGWGLTAVVATKTIPWLYKSIGISLPGGWKMGLVGNVLRCKKKTNLQFQADWVTAR